MDAHKIPLNDKWTAPAWIINMVGVFALVVFFIILYFLLVPL